MKDGRILAIAAAAVVSNNMSAGLAGLQACRNRTGLTQRQAAQAIGCPHGTYRNWELGANWPSSLWMPLIAETFRGSIEELYLPPQEGK